MHLPRATIYGLRTATGVVTDLYQKAKAAEEELRAIYHEGGLDPDKQYKFSEDGTVTEVDDDGNPIHDPTEEAPPKPVRRTRKGPGLRVLPDSGREPREERFSEGPTAR